MISLKFLTSGFFDIVLNYKCGIAIGRKINILKFSTRI